MIEGGHVDDIPAGKGYMRSNPRALLAERLLGNLNDDLLTLFEQVCNGWRGRFFRPGGGAMLRLVLRSRRREFRGSAAHAAPHPPGRAMQVASALFANVRRGAHRLSLLLRLFHLLLGAVIFQDQRLDLPVFVLFEPRLFYLRLAGFSDRFSLMKLRGRCFDASGRCLFRRRRLFLGSLKITEQLCAPRLRTGLDMGHALKFVLVQTTSRSVGDRVRGRQLLRTIAGDHSHIGRDIGVVGGLGRRLQGALLRRFLLGSGRSLFLSGLVRAALARSLAPVFSQRFSWQHCEFRLLFSRLLCRGRQFCRTRVLRLGKSPAPVPPSPRAATSPVAIAFLGVLGLDPLRRFGGVFGSLALSTGFRLRSRGALVLPSQRALLLPRRTLFGRRRDPLDLLAGFLEEVRHVQERVALKAQVNEGGLHARQDARNPPLLD